MYMYITHFLLKQYNSKIIIFELFAKKENINKNINKNKYIL